MDIGILWDTAQFRGDWFCAPGDLGIDPGGLRSAVLLSLFTDQAAPPDYVPPAGSSPDRHGWWGDLFADTPIGSLLWTLDRFKTGPDTLLAAQDMCSAALQWLKDAGVVDTVTVQTAWQAPGLMAITVTLTQPPSPPQVFVFAWAWQGA